MPVTNAKNLSLQKKSAARIATVQCLYKVSVNKEKLVPEKQVAALRVQLFKNPEEQKATIGAAVEPNYTLMGNILEAVKSYHKDMDKMIESTLSKEWKRERMSPILIAILQCAIAELFYINGTAHKIILDEYSRLTRSFFSEKEVKFVYAAITNIAENFE